MKACRKCGEAKELSEFSLCSRAKDGKQSNCRACQSALAAAWNKANPERRREIDNARYARNPEKRGAVSKAVRAKKIEQYRARDRVYSKARYLRESEKCKAATRSWVERNRDKSRAAGAANESNRRARIAGAPGSHTKTERADLVASYLGLCAYCDSKATAIDHVVPIARGGSNDIGNLVPACKSCNSAKKDRSLLTFLSNRKAA